LYWSVTSVMLKDLGSYVSNYYARSHMILFLSTDCPVEAVAPSTNPNPNRFWMRLDVSNFAYVMAALAWRP
jgi:hypothetical protein